MPRERVAIDLSGWKSDKSYGECLKLCERLKLIEIEQHGEHDYGRLTQDGINVLQTLLQLVSHSAFPENALKKV